jgi:hypothetical protein
MTLNFSMNNRRFVMNRRIRVMYQACQTPFPAIALKHDFSAAIALDCPVDPENLMGRD